MNNFVSDLEFDCGDVSGFLFGFGDGLGGVLEYSEYREDGFRNGDGRGNGWADGFGDGYDLILLWKRHE